MLRQFHAAARSVAKARELAAGLQFWSDSDLWSLVGAWNSRLVHRRAMITHSYVILNHPPLMGALVRLRLETIVVVLQWFHNFW